MKNKNLIIFGLIVLILISRPGAAEAVTSEDVFKVSYLGDRSLPRGLRNNNPGNLKISTNAWRGKVPEQENTDGVFEQFFFYVNGIRAMIRLVRDSYIGKGYNTITKIISRYAPAGTSENNNTSAYITHVVLLSGIPADQVLSKKVEPLSRLIPAMAFHENGQEAISPDLFSAAWTIS